MTSGIRTIIYPVKDMASAKVLYSTLLGVEPYADSPYYVGYRVADQEIGLSPAPYGVIEGMTGPVSYLHVEDIRDGLQSIVAAGGKEQQPVKDVGGGRLIASATDAEGNVIGLVQESNPANHPIRYCFTVKPRVISTGQCPCMSARQG